MSISFDSFSIQGYKELKAGQHAPSTAAKFVNGHWELKGATLPQHALTLAYPWYQLGNVKYDNGHLIPCDNMSELGSYALIIGDTAGRYNTPAFKKASNGLTSDFVTDIQQKYIDDGLIPGYYLVEIGNAFYIGAAFSNISYLVPFAINAFDFECNLKELHIYYKPMSADSFSTTTVILKSRHRRESDFVLHKDYDSAIEMSDYCVTFRTNSGDIISVLPDIMEINSARNDFDYLSKYGAGYIMQLGLEPKQTEDERFDTISLFCNKVRDSYYAFGNKRKAFIPRFSPEPAAPPAKLQPTVLSDLSITQVLDAISSPIDYNESIQKIFYDWFNYLKTGDNYQDFYDGFPTNHGLSAMRYAESLRYTLCNLWASQCISITPSQELRSSLLKLYYKLCDKQNYNKVNAQNFLAMDFIMLYLLRNLQVPILDTRLINALVTDSFVSIAYSKLAESFGSIYPEVAATMLFEKHRVFKLGKSERGSLPNKIPYAVDTIERDPFEWMYAVAPLSGDVHLSHIDTYWGIDMLCEGPFLTAYLSIPMNYHGEALKDSSRFTSYARDAIHIAWDKEFYKRYPDYCNGRTPMPDSEISSRFGKEVSRLRMPFARLEHEDPYYSIVRYLCHEDASYPDKVKQICATYEYVSLKSLGNSVSLERLYSGQVVSWRLIQAGLSPFISCIPKSLSHTGYADDVYYGTDKQLRGTPYFEVPDLNGLTYLVSLFQRLVLAEMSASSDPACSYKVPATLGKYARGVAASPQQHLYYYLDDFGGLVIDKNIRGDLAPVFNAFGSRQLGGDVSDLTHSHPAFFVGTSNNKPKVAVPAIIDGQYYAKSDKVLSEELIDFIKEYGVKDGVGVLWETLAQTIVLCLWCCTYNIPDITGSSCII